MLRIRSIKPDFFQSDHLARVSIPARLLFVGLWQLADREGRLRWRPAKFRALFFPYDRDVDAPSLAAELVAVELVTLYETEGDGVCAWIPGFPTHQRPDHRESASRLPPYHNANAKSKMPRHAAARPGIPGRKGREGTYRGTGASTVRSPSSTSLNTSRAINQQISTPSEVPGAPVWAAILAESHFQPRTKREWLEPCRVAAYTPGRLLVLDAGTPTRAAWVNAHYRQQLAEAAKAVEPELRVEIRVAGKR